MAGETHDLENVLEDLKSTADSCDGEMTVGEALDAFSQRSFGAMLTVVALVAALPVIGAIPGVSILTGVLVMLIAVQFLFGRQTPWTPSWIRGLSVDADAMSQGAEKAMPYAARIDTVIRPRLQAITTSRFFHAGVAVASILIAFLFVPAAIVPFGVFAPALSVMALGLALLGNDGLLALVGLGGGVGSFALVFLLV